MKALLIISASIIICVYLWIIFFISWMLYCIWNNIKWLDVDDFFANGIIISLIAIPIGFTASMLAEFALTLIENNNNENN